MAICPQRAIEVGGPGAFGTVNIHNTRGQGGDGMLRVEVAGPRHSDRLAIGASKAVELGSGAAPAVGRLPRVPATSRRRAGSP
jgi:hypothetical protein